MGMALTKPKRDEASGTMHLREYGLTKKQLAETIGLAPEALYKSRRLGAAKTQSRLREMNEISDPRFRLGGRSGAVHGLVPSRADPCVRRADRGTARQVRPGQRAARLSRFDRGRRLCVRFQGLCYRAHDPRWSFTPLSGDGAAIHGGRFNPKGRPALYLALDPMTAIKEAAQGFARKFEPYILCTYEVDCEDVIDLRSEAKRRAAGVHEDDVASAWFAEAAAGREPASWRLAKRPIDAGAAGMLAPSFVRGASPADANLILWDWRGYAPYKVAVFDPSGRLPKNQLSWE